MNTKFHVRNNFLIYTYLIFNFIILFFAFQKDRIIENKYDFSLGMIYHMLIIFIVVLGYIPKNPNKVHNCSSVKRTIVFKNFFFLMAYFLVIFGLITSVATIQAVISPKEYFEVLLNGESINDIRTESGEKGLGGIFKMFNYSPLAVYLVVTALKNCFYVKKNNLKNIEKLQRYSLIGAIIKIFFSLDRLTILAILISLIYEKIIVKKFNYKLLLILPILYIILEFTTKSRMVDSSVSDFVATYSKLSLINFNMVIESYDDWTYGWNTFLSPLIFICKFFGIEKNVSTPTSWLWNPAQYFNSYLYIDFGIFSFFIQFLLGYFFRKLQIKVNCGYKFYVAIYLIIIFAICTFISVPIIRAVEFWLMLIISVFLTNYVVILDENAKRLR